MVFPFIYNKRSSADFVTGFRKFFGKAFQHDAARLPKTGKRVAKCYPADSIPFFPRRGISYNSIFCLKLAEDVFSGAEIGEDAAAESAGT